MVNGDQLDMQKYNRGHNNPSFEHTKEVLLLPCTSEKDRKAT